MSGDWPREINNFNATRRTTPRQNGNEQLALKVYGKGFASCSGEKHQLRQSQKRHIATRQKSACEGCPKTWLFASLQHCKPVFEFDICSNKHKSNSIKNLKTSKH